MPDWRAGVDPRAPRDEGGRTGVAAPLRRLRAAVRPGPLPGARRPTPMPGRPPRPIELGDAVDGAFEIAELGLDRLVATRAATVTTPSGVAVVDVTKTIVLGGDRRAPTLDADPRRSRNRSSLPVEATARPRVDAHAARRRRATRPPGGRSTGERSPHDAAGSAVAVTHARPGQRLRRYRGRRPPSRRRRPRGGRRSRPSRTRRAASSASTREPGCCCRGRWRWRRARPGP